MIRTAALLFAFAFFAAQSARGGDTRLAANSILINLFLVTAYFLDGFATAAQQLCGQSAGARDGVGFRKAVRLTAFWCLAFAAIASALALAAGGSFIDFLTTNADVRTYARDYLVFAALTPVAGALAFEFDGVFIGATWTRDMRNMMLVSLALYMASFYLARPFGNAGLWTAFLVFLLARGLTQWRRYLKLSAAAFPLAQSEAAEPIASASRG
jgi:MATE family multidrug resistance protein